MRPQAQARAGYYPTPTTLLPGIADVLTRMPRPASGYANYIILDPCAGTGEAMTLLAKALTDPEDRINVIFNAAEMEQNRADRMRSVLREHGFGSLSDKLLHADAFSLQIDYGEASVLFLNPPYDHNREHGRLEQKFLDRFTPHLGDEGVLVFIVPYYALSASADYLATWYTQVQCYRFPDPEWNAFKQVVLFATRRESPLQYLDSTVQQRCHAWAADPLAIPPWSERPMAAYAVPEGSRYSTFESLGVDIDALCAGYALEPNEPPEMGLQADLTTRIYPVANPLKEGHVVQALAGNLLNGFLIRGNPDLLVNAVFEREYHRQSDKLNEDGEKVGEIQIQQPKFRVCVFNLRDHTYHDIHPGTEPTGSRDLDTMNTADLIGSYEVALTSMMHRQCPPMHDHSRSDDHIALPPTARTLFTAQESAVMTALKLLGTAPDVGVPFGTNPFVLGEVGSGKTTVAQAVAWALHPANLPQTWHEIRRTLRGTLWEPLLVRPRPVERVVVVCPPHLLKSWQKEIKIVLPGATVAVVQQISDLDVAPPPYTPGDPPGTGLVFFIISQSVAKLGGTIEPGAIPIQDGAQHVCPKCGKAVLFTAEDMVQKRRTCQHRDVTPMNEAGRVAQGVARLILPSHRNHHTVTLVQARNLHRTQKEWAAQATPRRAAPHIERILALIQDSPDTTALHRALALLVLSMPWKDDAIMSHIARSLATLGTRKANDTLRQILCMMSNEEAALVVYDQDVLPAMGTDELLYHNTHSITGRTAIRKVFQGEGVSGFPTRKEGGAIVLGECYDGIARTAAEALSSLMEVARFAEGEMCGEPLYQHANPFKKSRWPVATYLARQYPHDFLVVVDEGHDARTKDTAIQRAVGRLINGRQAMLLTGTLSTGKASGLHMLMWMMSHRFRERYGRNDKESFVNRYGYRKRLVEMVKRESEVVRYGAMTDLVETDEQSVRYLGEVPGILPLFWVQELAHQAIHIHKRDLEIDLPPGETFHLPIAPDAALLQRQQELIDSILARMRDDRDGKLFGQLSEAVSYADRCHRSTGNGTSEDAWEVRYPVDPESEEPPGVVARIPLFPDDYISPKEEKLLELVQQEITEGRRVIVSVVHINMAGRLKSLLAQHGIESAILRVESGKREDWIDAQIAKGTPVLITHYKAISTGLNNLTAFNTLVFYEPFADGIGYRQTIGRIDRPGATLPTRFYLLYYDQTDQPDLIALLTRKVRASMLLDGLGIEAALESAGASEEYDTAALDFGRLLYRKYEEGVPITPKSPAKRTKTQRKEQKTQRKPVQKDMFALVS